MNKIEAVKKFLGIDTEEDWDGVEVSEYDDSIFEHGLCEYLVLTEEEAYKRVTVKSVSAKGTLYI